MYARPRDLEAPGVRHNFPHLSIGTTFGAVATPVQCAEVESLIRVDGADAVLETIPKHYRPIAKLAAAGIPRKTIAQHLGISMWQVKDAVRAACRETGANNATELSIRLGGKPRSVGDAAAVLSPEHVPVVKLMAEGKSYQAIADALGLSLQCVHRRANGAMKIIGVSNRVLAAHWTRRYLLGKG